MIERDIYHLAQAKIASISKEFSRIYFDCDRLSSLGELVLKLQQKEAVSCLHEGKDVFVVFPTGFGKVKRSVGCPSILAVVTTQHH